MEKAIHDGLQGQDVPFTDGTFVWRCHIDHTDAAPDYLELIGELP